MDVEDERPFVYNNPNKTVNYISKTRFYLITFIMIAIILMLSGGLVFLIYFNKGQPNLRFGEKLNR